MISEEKMIEKMKKRKLRITMLCVLIGVFSVLIFLWSYVIERATGAVEVVARRYGPTVTVENMGEHLTGALTACSDLTLNASMALVYLAFSAGVLGYAGTMLIAELMGYGQRRLIVSMWERIERLEKGAQEPAQENV